ncbi:MAG: NAD(P)/FAD-dependent oxidoreductase [Fimbriimonadaceae bacterium]
MSHPVDVLIIGGGPVGLFGAFYAGLRGMSVTIVDSLPDLGGQLTALYPEKFVYDMPGFPSVLAKDLAREMIAQGTRFAPGVALGRTASSLERSEEGYRVGLDDGSAIRARTVIISAGAGAFSPTKIGVEREDEFLDRGVHYGVREKAHFAGRHVLIVGGGDSAFDWLLNLHPVCASIALVHRRDQFRAHEESIEEVRELGVPMHLFKVVKELHGTERLTAVTLEDTRDKSQTLVPTDALVVNIGFKSSLGPIKGWGLEIEKNQIVVDAKCETNLPGVFAVGDVCTYPEKLKLIATGVGEAVTAVCFAKTYLDPTAKLFPGHSSDMDL